MSSELDQELAMLRQLATGARLVSRRLTWRAAQQRRSTAIASIVRMLPRLLRRHPFRREKSAAGWMVSVETPTGQAQVLTIETATPGRTTQDLRSPIRLRVHQTALLDEFVLREIEARGLARVVAEPC
jgi:hypothetical protein